MFGPGERMVVLAVQDEGPAAGALRGAKRHEMR
jgi:hypothetical protein